jgi:hypothetical protein
MQLVTKKNDLDASTNFMSCALEIEHEFVELFQPERDWDLTFASFFYSISQIIARKMVVIQYRDTANIPGMIQLTIDCVFQYDLKRGHWNVLIVIQKIYTD